MILTTSMLKQFFMSNDNIYFFLQTAFRKSLKLIHSNLQILIVESKILDFSNLLHRIINNINKMYKQICCNFLI